MAWRDWLVPGVAILGFAGLGLHEARTPGLGSMQEAHAPASLLNPERNLADVYNELYPERSASQYFRALQASLCGEDRQSSPVCRRFERDTPAAMRDLLAKAVAAGNRSNEKIVYNYARALIFTGAPEGEVEAAIRRWQIDHPYSDLPDPRALMGRRSGS